MANNKIDNEIILTILRVRKNNNRLDLDSNYKEIKKPIDFEDATKEFLDDRIHALVNDGKKMNKLNRNADSYYIGSNLVDLETPNLLKSSQSVQRIAPALGANKTPQLQGVTLTPTNYIPNSSEDTRTMNLKKLR